jgi:type I restriction enzyme S subunit
MCDWKEYEFLSLLDCPVRNGIYKKKEFHGRGCKIVNMGELFAFPRIGNVEMKRVELSTKEKERYLLQPGDLIFARRSLTESGAGKCSIIKSISEDTTFESSIIRARPNLDISYPDYLYYYFNSPYGKYLLGTILRQVAVAGITGSDLMQLRLKIPPLPEQKAIASVLSSLDDKIDLLHRQNKTLEAMAETLFRQWFVEEAQEDWVDGCLGDVIELVYGKGLKKEIRTGTGYPVIGSSGVVGYHSEFLVEGPGIVIGRKGTLGKVIYLWDNFFPIDTTYYIKSKVESADYLYEYFLLKTLNFEEMNSDSAVPGLNRDIALSTEIKIAPLGKLQKFNQFTSTFIDKLRENENQIRTLERLRDTLLPKLMSGEVRVNI